MLGTNTHDNVCILRPLIISTSVVMATLQIKPCLNHALHAKGDCLGGLVVAHGGGSDGVEADPNRVG